MVIANYADRAADVFRIMTLERKGLKLAPRGCRRSPITGTPPVGRLLLETRNARRQTAVADSFNVADDPPIMGIANACTQQRGQN